MSPTSKLSRKRIILAVVAVLLIGGVVLKDNLAEVLSGLCWRVSAGLAIGLTYLGSHAGTVAALCTILGLVMNFTFQYLSYKRTARG